MSISEAWESLDAAMSGDDPDWDEPPEPIPPGALDQADRMLRRLARIQRRTRADAEVAAAQHAQINDWLARRGEQSARQSAWCEGALEAFHAAVLAAEPSRTTLDLPAGKLTARRAPARWEADDQVVIAYAVEHGDGDVVRLPPPQLDRNAMKARYVVRDEKDRIVAAGIDPRTGERVPGITVDEGVVVFTATPNVEGEN